MNKRSEVERLQHTVKFRCSTRELTRLETRAAQFTDGNVSELIRHSLTSMNTRPKPKKGKKR